MDDISTRETINNEKLINLMVKTLTQMHEFLGNIVKLTLN